MLDSFPTLEEKIKFLDREIAMQFEYFQSKKSRAFSLLLDMPVVEAFQIILDDRLRQKLFSDEFSYDLTTYGLDGLREYVIQNFEMWQQLFEEQEDQDEVKVDPKIAIPLIIGIALATMAYARYKRKEEGEPEPEPIAKHFEDIVLFGLEREHYSFLHEKRNELLPKEEPSKPTHTPKNSKDPNLNEAFNKTPDRSEEIFKDLTVLSSDQTILLANYLLDFEVFMPSPHLKLNVLSKVFQILTGYRANRFYTQRSDVINSPNPVDLQEVKALLNRIITQIGKDS